MSGNNSVNTTSAQDSNQNVSSQFKILIIASDDLPSTTQSLGLTDPTATSTNAKTNTLVTGGNAGGKGDFTSKIKIAIALSNKYPNIQICK